MRGSASPCRSVASSLQARLIKGSLDVCAGRALRAANLAACMPALRPRSLDAECRIGLKHPHAAASAQLPELAKPGAGVRMGHALGRLDRADAGAVCDLSRHRGVGARHPFQPRLGAGEHGAGLGGTGADHPDFDAGIGGDGGAGGDCRDRQRDQAVSDGGVGLADDADATDQTASSGAGHPFHRGHPVGRMLPPASAGAARAAHRVHAWARYRALYGLPLRDHARLWSWPPTCRHCSAPRSCC